MKRIVFLALGLMIAASALLAQETKTREPLEESVAVAPDSSFGVCAHLTSDSLALNKLRLMREAGILWTRTDFRWGTVDADDGTWNFDELDALVDEAQKNSVALLPILSQRDDRKPTLDEANFERWKEYVRATVTRYKDRLRCWEIINEPNLDLFWGPELIGRDYGRLLEAAYKIIKEIDPNLTVVHGGLAGTPAEYFEDEFVGREGEFFDVMNVHCYRGGMRHIESVQWFENDLKRMADVLARHSMADKPLWITEAGWSSLPDFGEMYNAVIAYTLGVVFQNEAPAAPFGYLCDERYAPSLFYQSGSLARMFPKENKTVQLSLDDLKGISPEKCSAILLPPGEAFPSFAFDDLVEYVRAGGVLFALGGIPFRYEVEQNVQGVWTQKTDEAPAKYRETFCLDYQTAATDSNVPAIAINRVAEAFLPSLTPNMRALFDGFGDTYQSTRFLSDRLFGRAESAIALMNGVSDDFSAPTAAIVRPKNFRGVIVASTIDEWETTNIATEEAQAIYIPQASLIARAAGIEKFFLYEFQSPETNPIDKESFFGLTHADLSAKPAFFAYRTLIEAMPPGSTEIQRRFADDNVVVRWRLKNGAAAWALWRPSGEANVPVKITGEIQRAFDYLGEPAAIDAACSTLTLSPKILYLVGPTEINF